MGSSAFKIIDLQQGSKAWLDWRKNGIGSSDAPAIMGENPWKNFNRLLKEKRHGSNFSNAAMRRGQELEPYARNEFEIEFGVTLDPACLQSTTFDWLRASVDGIAVDENVVVEIKCGEKAYQYSATKRSVPRYYYGQLQHILAVTDLKTIDYWCYLPSRPCIHIPVARDEPYIKRLLKAEKEFWEIYKKLA